MLAHLIKVDGSDLHVAVNSPPRIRVNSDLRPAPFPVADADQVTNGRKLINDAKAFTVSQLDAMGYKTIPSQANFMMIDMRREVKPLIAAFKDKKVQVGRLFPPFHELSQQLGIAPIAPIQG